MEQHEMTEIIIGAFYEVYNTLGYGFIEAVYQNALCKELTRLGVPFDTHRKITVFYKKEIVGYYEADIIAFDRVILELKAVRKLSFEHERQLRNYLKATGSGDRSSSQFWPSTGNSTRNLLQVLSDAITRITSACGAICVIRIICGK